MTDMVLNDFDIAPPEVVQHAAHDFAAALAATPQFRAFEQAAYAFQQLISAGWFLGGRSATSVASAPAWGCSPGGGCCG
jgi:hypothetical protein